eukprot:2261645-Alexandrium_andersonii.AAC.1
MGPVMRFPHWPMLCIRLQRQLQGSSRYVCHARARACTHCGPQPCSQPHPCIPGGNHPLFDERWCVRMCAAGRGRQMEERT